MRVREVKGLLFIHNGFIIMIFHYYKFNSLERIPHQNGILVMYYLIDIGIKLFWFSFKRNGIVYTLCYSSTKTSYICSSSKKFNDIWFALISIFFCKYIRVKRAAQRNGRTYTLIRNINQNRQLSNWNCWRCIAIWYAAYAFKSNGVKCNICITFY